MFDNVDLQTRPANILRNKGKWEAMIAKAVLQEIGDTLSNPEFAQFTERLYQWISTSTPHLNGDEDVNKLSEILNSIIETNPDLFKEFKCIIDEIFKDKKQFVIPQ